MRSAFALLFFTAALTAGAQTVHLEADFDDLTIDAPIGIGGPELGQPTYVSATIEAIVRDEPMATPCLEIADHDDYAAGAVRFDFLDDAEITSGFATIRCELWFPSHVCGDGFSVMVREHGSSAAGFTDLYFTSDGFLLALDATFHSVLLAEYDVGRVHSLAICHDLDAGDYDIWFDDVPVLVGEPHEVVGHGVGAVLFGCVHDPDLDGVFCVDNVLVTDEELELVGVADTPRSTSVLHPAAPNPFNPATTVTFELARQADVRLEILNQVGRRVVTLTNRRYEAGRHQVRWDGRSGGGQAMPSGVYLLRLTAGGEVSARPLTLVR